MGLELLAGVPHDRWRSHPYLVWPIAAFVPKNDFELTPSEQSIHTEHPIFLALKWRRLLDSEPSLTPALIASNQGRSPSRIRQILRLATLAPEIVDYRGLARIRSEREAAAAKTEKAKASKK